MAPYHIKLSAEVIEQDILSWHAEVVQHVYYRLRHHWRTAHEVDDAFWLIVLLEVCLVKHVVNEACNIRYTCLVSLRIWTVQSEVELEVRELLLDLLEVLEVECLLQRTSTIEEINLTAGLNGLEEVHDV